MAPLALGVRRARDLLHARPGRRVRDRRASASPRCRCPWKTDRPELGLVPQRGLDLAPLFVVFWIGFVVSQVSRWRRATGDLREQSKWLMAGGALCVFSGVTLVVAGSGSSTAARIVADASMIGIAAFPVAIGIGILKYPLYEIDRLVSPDRFLRDPDRAPRRRLRRSRGAELRGAALLVPGRSRGLDARRGGALQPTRQRIQRLVTVASTMPATTPRRRWPRSAAAPACTRAGGDRARAARDGQPRRRTGARLCLGSGTSARNDLFDRSLSC